MGDLAQAWARFQSGVGCVLRQWTVIQLAVDNGWGGGDSARKVAIMEEELLTMFKTKKQLFREEVEDYLLDYIDSQFSVITEDNSPQEVAALLTDMFQQCGKCDFTLADVVEERSRALAHSSKAKSVRAPSKDNDLDADSETDSSDDDMGDDDDEQPGKGAGGAPPRAAAAAAAAAAGGGGGGGGGGGAGDDDDDMGAAAGGVDEDGWSTVPKKGKGRRKSPS